MEAALLLVAYALSLLLGYLFLSLGNSALRHFRIDPRSIRVKWGKPLTYSAAGTAYGLLLSYLVAALYTIAHIQITLLRALAWLGLVVVMLFLVPALAGEAFQNPHNPHAPPVTDFLYAAVGVLLGCVAFVLVLSPKII